MAGIAFLKFGFVSPSDHIALHFLPFPVEKIQNPFFFSLSSLPEIYNKHIIFHVQGTADEVVDWSHGKQLWELCKEKYEPLWLSGGGHCNLELYPEFIKHLKKFVQTLGKSKATTNGSKTTTVESDNQSKASETGSADTFEFSSDVPEVSRNSLDSRLEKSRKSNKPEKSRMSTDRVDRFRRRKGLVW